MTPPERITDPGDPRLEVFRATRDPDLLRQHRAFIAESRQVVRRLLAGTRFAVRALLVDEPGLAAIADLLPRVPGVPLYLAERALLREVTGYRVDKGCLAVGEREPGWTRDDVLTASPPLLIGLDAVANPDNIGGIFRSAVAFGAGGVLLGPRCTDPLYRKAIRTSMGATLRLPFASLEPWPAALAELRSAGWRVIALTPDPGAVPIDALEPASRATKTILLLGNEGEGLSRAALAAADVHARIPMAGAEVVDSLNVGVAAGIALHRLAPR